VIKIVTDSSVDLPDDIVRDLDITVVPLTIHFGDKTYVDGRDLTADAFYDLLTTETAHPRTAQPSVGVFEETYRSLAAKGHEVVVLTLAAELSGAHNSAVLAVQGVPAAHVTVIDSRLLSMGMGMIVMQAARLAREGRGRAEIEAAVQSLIPRTSVYIVVDTMTYLQRGGRIGRASAFAGALLNVKPILSLQNGTVVPLQRVRSRAKALQEMLNIARKEAPIEEAYIMHAAAPALGEEFEKMVEPLYGGSIRVLPLGPVIGVHVGPGALGLAILSAR